MLRTITELVPFGQDENASRISVTYLANLGRNPDGTCDYLIGYYEKASPFSDNKNIRKFKFIDGYDRMASNFDMFQRIFSDKEDWSNIHIQWMGQVVDIFDKRAKNDIGFEL